MNLMFIKGAFKSPLLTIGIIMMTIFVFQLREQGFFGKSRFRTTSCTGTIAILKKYQKDYWDLDCDENTMILSINYLRSEYLGQLDQMKAKDTVRSFLYKDLANTLTTIAVRSPNELLERVDIIRLQLKLPQLTVNVITEGKDIAPLYQMRDTKNIANLLKETVQVQELWNE